MFLVKFEACLNLMIRRAIALLVLGFLIQSEQIAVADLTDDLEELEPKKSEEQSQPNTTSSSKQKSKKNTQSFRIKKLIQANNYKSLPGFGRLFLWALLRAFN